MAESSANCICFFWGAGVADAQMIPHAAALHRFIFCRVCGQAYGLGSKADSVPSRSQRLHVRLSSDYAASVSRAGYEVLAHPYLLHNVRQSVT